MDKYCYQIKSNEELLLYLKEKHGIAFLDCNYQLPTNYGYIYELKNDEVVFLTHNLHYNGILFKTKACFSEVIESDIFSIENPVKNLFEGEIERIKNFHSNIQFYQDHLNKVLRFDFKDISRESVLAHLKKMVGREIHGMNTDKDVIGLIAVIGDLVKRELNCKWFIEKWYGMYNPYFEPSLLSSEKKVIKISSIIMGKLKWEIAKLESIFNSPLLIGIDEGIDYDDYSQQRTCILLE